MDKAADVAGSAAETVSGGMRSAAEAARGTVGTVFEETERGGASEPTTRQPAGRPPCLLRIEEVVCSSAACRGAPVRTCSGYLGPALPEQASPPLRPPVTKPIMPKGDAGRGESPSTSGTTMNDRLRWK